MRAIPFKLRDDCVKYKIVELEYTTTITLWATNHTDQGADIWFDFANYASWVVVPESLLDSFLKQYGHLVSSI